MNNAQIEVIENIAGKFVKLDDISGPLADIVRQRILPGSKQYQKIANKKSMLVINFDELVEVIFAMGYSQIDSEVLENGNKKHYFGVSPNESAHSPRAEFI